MDVNFLGSGYDDPGVGSGGSGIYQGKDDSIVRLMPEQATSHLLVNSVEKKKRSIGSDAVATANDVNQDFRGSNPNILTRMVRYAAQQGLDAVLGGTRADSLFLKSDHLDVYTTEMLDFEKDKGVFNKKICNHDFCCDFNITYEQTKDLTHSYRAVVFNGVRSFDGVATGGVQICSIIFCNSSEASSCPSRSKEEFAYNFKEITISGQFLHSNSSQMPDTLVDDVSVGGLVPLTPKQFHFSSESEGDTDTLVTIKLETSVSNLMTFGIYGRDFSRDGEPQTRSSGVIVVPTAVIFLLLSVLYEVLV